VLVALSDMLVHAATSLVHPGVRAQRPDRHERLESVNRMLDFFDHMGTLTEASSSSPSRTRSRRCGCTPVVVTAGRIDVEQVDFAHPDGISCSTARPAHPGAKGRPGRTVGRRQEHAGALLPAI